MVPAAPPPPDGSMNENAGSVPLSAIDRNCWTVWKCDSAPCTYSPISGKLFHVYDCVLRIVGYFACQKIPQSVNPLRWSTLKIVSVLNASSSKMSLSRPTLYIPLFTSPSDVPVMERERLALVWVGTDENHSSLTAYALASLLITGTSAGVYIIMIC